jgi:DNA-binding PadR family transcriptional regulator
VAKGRKKKSTPEKRTLILWALLVREKAGAFQNELKPQPIKDDRIALENDGLVRSEMRENRRIWIEVTDRGWDWAGRNLAAPMPTGSTAGTQIFQALLLKLKTFMEVEGKALSDILSPKSNEKRSNESIHSPEKADSIAVRKRVRDAYLTISSGRLNTRVLLRELREKLDDIERSVLDAALRHMQIDQEASLYQLDNRSEITDADRSAALYDGSEPRHILWIER